MASLKEVTKGEFFDAMGSMDVHPKINAGTLRDRLHTSMWETRTRSIIGKTINDSWAIEPTRFFLVTAL